MIPYGDLVQYIKDNHISWNTDLFDVLRGFFEQYSLSSSSTFIVSKNAPVVTPPVQQEIILDAFEEPKDGEYTIQDLMNLFNS